MQQDAAQLPQTMGRIQQHVTISDTKWAGPKLKHLKPMSDQTAIISLWL